jgi:hypothetical protein
MAIVTPKIQHWLNTRTEPVPDSVLKSESERIRSENQELLFKWIEDLKKEDLPARLYLQFNW